MAKRAYKLLLLFSILSILTLSSGTLVGFSKDARKMSEASSPSPKKNKVHSSHIWILAAGCEVLESLPNSRIPLCLYVNTPPSENRRKSKVSTSWLTTHLQSFIQNTNSTSVIISSSTSKLGLRQLSLLLSTLHSIQSSLKNFDLNHQVRVAVAVSLSALENSRTRAREFQGIMKFIQKHEFLILVETRIDEESSMGDHFIEVKVERATSAAAAFPYTEVVVVLTVKSSLVPTAVKVADFTKKIMRSLQTPTQNRSQTSAIFVEISPVEELVDKELTVNRQKMPDSSHRALLDLVNKSIPAIKTSQHDAIDPPTNPSPVIPVTNPVTTPAATPYTNTAPTIVVTVPSVNPITVTPQNPATTPVPVPPVTEPIINPVNPPFTVSPSTPIFNPVTTYPFPPPGNTPVTMPLPTPIPNPVQSPGTNDSPMAAGQSWCVARTDATESALQAALDYACGVGGVDCSAIQQTGNCYIPNSIQSHASYAFNSYYQKNPVLTNCDFGGTGILVNNNPSTGSCTYQTSPSSSTAASSSSSSSVLNTSNPTTTTSNFGTEVPPNSGTSLSISKDLKPVLTSIILTAAFVTGKVLIHI